MLLFLMACRREIPATVSITADTGWEKDRVWSNGRRGPVSEYFDEVVAPLANEHLIDARFVRSRYLGNHGPHFEPLMDHVRKCAETGVKPNIPMFGSRKGRLRQVCTDKWKIRALRQEARRMGAKTNCNAQGIHVGESGRRVKGWFLRNEGRWSIYQTIVVVNGVEKAVKWQTHYYPLVDLGLNRRECQERVIAEHIPYLLSSECDGCPHKDLPRWERTSPEVLKELSELEAMFNGEFFFTPERMPLMEAIEVMRQKRAKDPEKFKIEADFGCQNAICGV